jgi:hypothetical protein
MRAFQAIRGKSTTLMGGPHLSLCRVPYQKNGEMGLWFILALLIDSLPRDYAENSKFKSMQIAIVGSF